MVKVPTNTWFTKIDIVIFLTEPSVKAWVPFVTTLKPEIRLVVGLRLSFTVLIYSYSTNLNINFDSLKWRTAEQGYRIDLREIVCD